jgi:hypothetical protein
MGFADARPILRVHQGVYLVSKCHLNRAISDSYRSWRGQANPTNNAYRTGRGLRCYTITPGEKL